MPRVSLSPVRTVLSALVCAAVLCGARPILATDGWSANRDRLVARLRSLAAMDQTFGPAFKPIYDAALPWYEQWGGRDEHAVDGWMVPPDRYAAELADSLEHGRNFLAVNRGGALIPLAFEARSPAGRTIRANYWIILPSAFPEAGRKFPLVVSLPGSGWLGHPISYVRQTRRPVPNRPAFEVTPVNEGGPWDIDFLNALLDRLLATLPIDPDRVYVEGHSLGAMATWEWAMANPERFAAICPESGRGEPFRAVRLRNIPTWVIHGADDDVVFAGYSDQMVSALLDCGGRVRYSLLPGVGHNTPGAIDEQQVRDWFFRQRRGHEPAPQDPRDLLGLGPEGFSAWSVIIDPPHRIWKSPPIPAGDGPAERSAAQRLFRRAQGGGALVDAPLITARDLSASIDRIELAVPPSLRRDTPSDPSAGSVPATRYVHFYFRGTTEEAIAHLPQILTQMPRAGLRADSGTVWIVPLTLWRDTDSFIAEYRLRLL